MLTLGCINTGQAGNAEWVFTFAVHTVQMCEYMQFQLVSL